MRRIKGAHVPLRILSPKSGSTLEVSKLGTELEKLLPLP
jgi:hypothetical protein